MTSSIRKLVAFSLPLLLIPSASTSRERVMSSSSLASRPVLSSFAIESWIAVTKRQQDMTFLAAWTPPQPVATVHGPNEGTEGTHHRGYATAKECVSWVENGGDYGRSSNPSHFGRYQFSRSTWAAYGGDPATWGSASPAEQDAVFETAWASPNGPNQWLPYDGCGPL